MRTAGFSLAAMVVLAFIVGLCISLMGSSAMIARRQSVLFGERYRQETCRAVLPVVGVVLAAHGYPRASMERYPWTLPCDRADDCPERAYAVKKSGLSFRALPTTAGYLLFVWQGKNQICRGDRYVPVDW